MFSTKLIKLHTHKALLTGLVLSLTGETCEDSKEMSCAVSASVGMIDQLPHNKVSQQVFS